MAVFEQRTQKVKLADLERFIIHSTLLEQKEKEGKQEEADLIKRISPFAWQNVNLLGRFEFQRQQKTINIQEMISLYVQKIEWQQLKTVKV